MEGYRAKSTIFVFNIKQLRLFRIKQLYKFLELEYTLFHKVLCEERSFPYEKSEFS